MGKNSLIKSTDKKKAKTKKKEDEVKTKTAAKTSTPSAKSAKKSPKSKKATAVKTKNKTPAKKAAPKLTKKNLIFKKFDPLPGKPGPMPAPKAAAVIPDAPPLITSDDPKEAERLRALLKLTFSMEEVKAAAKEPEPASEPVPLETEPPAVQPEPAKSPMSIKDLIFKKFDPLSGKPEPVPAPKAAAVIPDAPPLITSDDPKEAERLRALLKLTFSMEEVKAAAKEPEPAPVTETKAPAETISDAEIQKVNVETPRAEQPQPEASRTAAGKQPAEAVKAPPPEAEKATIETGLDAEFTGEPDPVQRAMKYGIVGFIVLVLLLVGASYKNSDKFFIETKHGAIDISRGRFSPMGKKHFIVLHGVQLPQAEKSTYTRKDIYPIIYNYYLAKADALLNVKTLPDYESIKGYLHSAKDYAITRDMKAEISDRLNTIDRMTLMFKADVSIRKNTPESLDQASAYLKSASKLTSDETQTEMILKRMAEIKDRQAALAAAAQAGAEQPAPAAPPAQTETEQGHE